MFQRTVCLSTIFQGGVLASRFSECRSKISTSHKLTSSFLILSILLQSIVGIFLLSYPANTANAAYLPLTINSDLSIAGPYDTITVGTGNIGTNMHNIRDFIAIGNKYRVRQSGTISRVRLYVAQANETSEFFIKIWRKDGLTYDLVGTSNNLAGNMVAGQINTIDLTTPITGVQEGDYIGYTLKRSSAVQIYQFHAKTITGVKTYYLDGVTAGSTDYDWEAVTNNLSNCAVPIEIYMQSPQVVFIGDSIIAGHPGHYSFLETTATTNIASTIEKQLESLTGYTYQNMGIGSQTTSLIAARFTSDVVNIHPRVAVLEGGVNDIALGITKATFLANWTTMLNACRDNDIIPVVIPIMPWTNGNTTQMTTRDDWNASLIALAQTYEDAIIADMSSAVGQYAADGPEGNLWDIKTAYNADGVHFNSAGHGAIAAVIAAALEESTDHLTITGTATQTAGSAQTVTLRAINNIGDIHTGYTGDKTITLSGSDTIGAYTPTFTDKNGTDVNFGSSGTVTFANGVATTVVKLYKAGNTEIEATDGAYSTSGNNSYDLNVAVTPEAVAGFSILSSLDVISGNPFALTLTAKDAYGNTTTDVDSSLSLAVDYGTLNISLLDSTQFTDDGLYAGNVIVFGISQDRNIILTVRSGAVESTANISVTGVSGSPFLPPAQFHINLSDISSGTLPQDVTQIAISRTPSFNDVSFQPFDPEKFKTIGSTKETLYLKFRTTSGAVSDTIIYTPQTSSLPTIQDGDIIQCQNSDNPFAVYIVKTVNNKKYIRHIVSLSIFNHYRHLKWENLKQVDSLESFHLSGWVRVNTGSNGQAGPKDRVYEINADQSKHFIDMTQEEFFQHGGSEEAIYSINIGELNLYANGPAVKVR